MRRMNRAIVGSLLVLSLLLAPVAFAQDGADDGWSLVDWVQDVVELLLSEESEDDGGAPDFGPAGDPVG